MPPIKTIAKLAILPLIGLLFLVVPLVMLVKRSGQPDILTLDAPGTADFSITEPGDYLVWRQVTGVSGNDEFVTQSPELPPGLRISILRASDDSLTTTSDSVTSGSARVPLKESQGTTMHNGSVHKTSLFSARLDPGKYRLVAQNDGEPMTLMLTKDLQLLKGLVMLFASFALGACFIVAGLIVIIVFVIRKAASKSPGTPAPHSYSQ